MEARCTSSIDPQPQPATSGWTEDGLLMEARACARGTDEPSCLARTEDEASASRRGIAPARVVRPGTRDLGPERPSGPVVRHHSKTVETS